MDAPETAGAGRGPELAEPAEPEQADDALFLEAAIDAIVATFPPTCPGCGIQFRLRAEARGEYRSILERVREGNQ